MRSGGSSPQYPRVSGTNLNAECQFIFTTRLTWRLMPDTEIMEMVCLENNRSIDHIVRGPDPAR